jgi:hypothetical protein
MSAYPSNNGSSLLDLGGGGDSPSCKNECNTLNSTMGFRLVGPTVRAAMVVVVVVVV